MDYDIKHHKKTSEGRLSFLAQHLILSTLYIAMYSL